MSLKKFFLFLLISFILCSTNNIYANDKTQLFEQIKNIIVESNLIAESKLNNLKIQYNAFQINKKYDHSIRDNTFDPESRKIKRVDMQAIEYVYHQNYYRIDRDVVTQSSMSSDRNKLIDGTDGTMFIHRKVGHILTPTIEARFNQVLDFEIKINPSWTIKPRSDRKIGYTIAPSALNCLYSYFIKNDDRYISTLLENANQNERMYFNSYIEDDEYRIEFMEKNKVMPRDVKRLSLIVKADSPEKVLKFITYDSYEYVIEYINIEYDENDNPIHISHYKCYDKIRSTNPDDVYEASGVVFEIDILSIEQNEIQDDGIFNIDKVIAVNDRIHDQINGKSYIFDGKNHDLFNE